MKYDLDYVKKIAKIINDNELSEIILKDGEKAITVRKNLSQSIASPVSAAPVQDSNQNVDKNIVVQNEVSEPAKKGIPITSPMVGAFYASPAPGAKPFVKVGDIVSTGQVVCIVEAMKLMNEIESEVSGKITEICVEDGQSVEYGQVLMYVE